MTEPSTTATTTRDNVVFRALSDERRREVLSILVDRTAPIDVEDLAVHAVAATEEQSLLSVTEADALDRVTTLHHDVLPVLADAGLVAWDREAETVETTDHPALSDPKFARILDAEAENWDDVLAALQFERSRVALSALAEDGSMDRRALASAVARRVSDGEDDPSEAVVDDLEVTLHHRTLPHLAAADLIEYDGTEGEVTYLAHSHLDEEWLDSRPTETPRTILPNATNSEDVWTIEGRDDVIARGQSLFEQADDELFLMFTTTGLLEDGCLRRLHEAVDRGVDVYVGSQTPEVRDLVREEVPGAVIWEPQMDWLNLPPEYEKVGRLVFADREAVMLATLGEDTDRGVPAETAITGAGVQNPFVVLLRDMLGSRLDHLDAQSEDFLAEIPL